MRRPRQTSASPSRFIPACASLPSCSSALLVWCNSALVQYTAVLLHSTGILQITHQLISRLRTEQQGTHWAPAGWKAEVNRCKLGTTRKTQVTELIHRGGKPSTPMADVFYNIGCRVLEGMKVSCRDWDKCEEELSFCGRTGQDEVEYCTEV